MTFALLWFHAFNRDDATQLAATLRGGVNVDPKYGAKTRANEVVLSISPPCSYAYLGRTLEPFGSITITFALEELTGSVSPFDTGGLVKHIGPVCNWEVDQKRAYLKAFTWANYQLGDLLKKYPADSAAEVRAYLKSQRPAVPGPHVFWPEQSEKPEEIQADIWLEGQGGDERSYLWEIRTPTGFPGGSRIAHWTCDSQMRENLLLYLEGVSDPVEAEVIAALMERWVEGGTGTLVAQLRDRQEAA
jgi:hypothetical protein